MWRRCVPSARALLVRRRLCKRAAAHPTPTPTPTPTPFRLRAQHLDKAGDDAGVLREIGAAMDEGRVEEAERLVAQLGDKPTLEGARLVAFLLQHWRIDSDVCWSWFDRFRKSEFGLDLYVWKRIARTFRDANDAFGCRRIATLSFIVSNCIPYDLHAELLRCLALLGEHVACEEWIEYAEHIKHPVPATLFPWVIRALAKAGDFEQCLVYLDRLRALKLPLSPPPQAVLEGYNEVIRAYARAGKLERCGDLLDQMDRDGISPDRRSFMAIFEGLARAAAIDKFRTMWKRFYPTSEPVQPGNMEACASLSLHPKTSEVCRLLNAWASVGHAEQFYRLLSRHIQLLAPVLTAYLSALCRMGVVDAVEKLLCELSANGTRLTLENYLQLLELYARKRPDRCMQIFTEMKAAGFRPELSSCRWLLIALFRDRKEEEARQLWNDWKRNGVVPASMSSPSTLSEAYSVPVRRSSTRIDPSGILHFK